MGRFLLGGAVAAAAMGTILLGACGTRPTAPPSEEIVEAQAALRPATAGRRLPGMVPYRGSPHIAADPVCANPQLSYFGGPILQSPIIIGVFWTSSVNPTLQANIGQFFADITQSSYWAWLHEYDTVGLTPGTNQAFLPGSWGGNFTIKPQKCAPGGNNCQLTDDDLQAELARQIDLGVLPAPTLDCTGNVRTLYMIELPPNISLSGPLGGGQSCSADPQNPGFCAYHFTGTYGPKSLPLVYGAMMDYFTGPCAQGCGSDATALDNTTDVHSHEIVEAATDADIGLNNQVVYAAPAGWGDNDNQCGEIADICVDGSPGDTITVNGRSWVVQQVWSNLQGKCTSTGPVPAVCSGTTLTNCRKCSCGDDGNACNGSTSTCETGTANVLFGACEQCTSADNTCTAGGGTCQQSSTPAQDDICTGCTPLTTCPSGQACGTAPDGCGGTIPCGTCTAPLTCGGGGNPNVCGCTPAKTCPAGENCGTVSDGCGGMITCGICAAPLTCGGGGKPNVCGAPCLPKTCANQGFDCGQASDGCGGILGCGTCPTGETCGGAGVANHCGVKCLPFTCPELGAQCGPIGDGCGGILQCGNCPNGQACGGGGVPNQCSGCVPTTCAKAGASCGAISDGCGGILQCGTCSPPSTCGGGGVLNQCGCTPLESCPFGDECGTAPDGCGGVVVCGSCPPPSTCGGGGVTNQCSVGCTKKTTCPIGFTCGTTPDGCGGTLPCGVCSGGEVCSSDNRCVPGADAGGGTGGSASGTGGEGSWEPIWGRATCATAPAPRPASPVALLGLVGVVALGARRRRGRG